MIRLWQVLHPSFFRKFDLFAELDDRELSSIAAVAKVRRYAKDDVVCVVNLDAWNEQEGVCVIPVALGWPPAFEARDLLTGEDFVLRAGRNYVKLSPGKSHVLRVGR